MSSKNFYGLTGDVTIDGGILNVANTNVSGNVTSTSLFVSNVATLGTTKTFVVTAGGGLYSIDGNSQASLELHEGQTYIFDITASNAGGHPFKISQAQESGEYTNGVDDSVTNYIKFTVPFGAPTTLYYYCTQHSGMGATISISPESELVVSGRIVASGNVEASKITASANVEVTGNVVASTFVGDGSLLTGISTVTSSGLQVVTDNSPTTTNTIQFTNPTTSLRASSNIVATGNVTADHFVGDGSQLSGIVTSVSLGEAVNTGNITSNTVQFTNVFTSLTASGNVEVAGNVITSGNVEAAYFIGDGSKLSGIVTSVSLGDAVNTGNITSNTVQFTNVFTSLTASGNVEVTGNVVAGYFIGDGSRLTGLPSGGGSGTSQWTNTVTTNELYYTAGSVGISNANPIHDLSIGSNLYVDDDATDGILKVTGNVNATYFVGDGSRLINLPAGGGSTNWTTSGDPVNKIYYPQNPGITSVSVGIMNAAPQHTLSVGSNLFVDDTGSNVLVVDGDITAESMFLGALGIKPSYPLETVTDAGNVTPHTISFTNPTLGFTTASNVEIGGALVVGKGTLGGSNLEVGNANLFVNTELTRVGIGTDEPAATLHVNGSLAVDGPLTFGTVNVAAQHGLEAITAVSNTTPLTIELQNVDTSLVTTGNVEVGGNVTVSENLTVSGNVVASQNITISGNTFYTSPMSVSVDSNVVTEYTGPHDRPLRKYPEVELDVNVMTSPGVGGYIVAHSGQFSDSHAGWTVFGEEFTTTNAEISLGSWIDGSPGSYAKETADAYNGVVGSITTAVQTAGTLKLASNTPVGAWISLELPTSIKLQRIEMRARLQHASETDLNEVALQSFPREFGIWGYDGSNWVLLKSVTGHSANSVFGYTPTHVNATTAYNKYAIVVTRTNAVGGSNSDDKNFTAIGQLYFYGHEEGSGSLDTTLKTVYNVPATTGTQLEVYYDGQDYTADTDFDQANEVLDKSGNNLHGSQTGGVGFDSTYKAFTFDGTGDYILTPSLSNFADTGKYSISLWIKIPNYSTRQQVIYQFGHGIIGESFGLDLTNGVLSSFVFQQTPNLSSTGTKHIQNNWFHYTTTFDSDGTRSNMYINGVLDSSTSAMGLATIPSNPYLILGSLFIGDDPTAPTPAGVHSSLHFDGSIANFRLYSKALNADQVKELYDYQKDYFLGSKSQVTLYKGHLGVGVTEPSGQLELAGDERIQEYPPRALTGYETLVEGHGVFCAYASSYYTASNYGYYPFDKNQTSKWASQNLANYNGTGQAYSASRQLGTDTVKGEYVVLKLPYKIKLKSTKIQTHTPSSEAVKDFIIYGSNDGSTWSPIFTKTSDVYNSSGTSHDVNSTDFYDRFAIVCTRTNGSTYIFALTEWRLFGTPGPTTLDKGSLTLGRSLDVPRVSRYDVDTETPRPEKLVVDFDTTVNSSPTDISGKGNHGRFVGGASYSAADKAFQFDGNQDFIETGSGSNVISGSNPPFTASVWINYSGSEQGYVTPFSIEPATYGTNTNVWFYIRDTTKKPTLQFENNYVEFSEPGTSTGGATSNTWHHLAVSYNGSSAIGGRRCWLNGIEQTSSAVVGSAAGGTLTLGTTRLTIGSMYYNNNHIHEMIGFISNFKLYNVALEPSEVKKLYNLGRTGRSMVISDTAVGIGKVPEAQLDVRGIIKGQSPAVFSAKASAAMTATAAGAIALFGTVITDTAGGWDSVNHRYYPKVPGFYIVNAAQFTIVTTNTYVVIRIDKNGVEYSSTTGFAGPNGYPNTSLTALIYLSVGDYVRCRIGSDTNRTTASSHRFEIVHVGM